MSKRPRHFNDQEIGEARRRRRSTARSTAQRRSGTTRSRTSGTARTGRVDDYTDFMNRYK